ncbi:hypothetical protein [Dactylosporangium sp. NPDC051484]|uniref:hypothetical protein n=1 Tax=Dactylosporangium sp. NPDC051484 TaxID=3154942 RepID=UPI00344E84BB
MDDEPGQVAERGLSAVPDDVWGLAVHRASAIGPLAGAGVVGHAAAELGMSRRQVCLTLRRWRAGRARPRAGLTRSLPSCVPDSVARLGHASTQCLPTDPDRTSRKAAPVLTEVFGLLGPNGARKSTTQRHG